MSFSIARRFLYLAGPWGESPAVEPFELVSTPGEPPLSNADRSALQVADVFLARVGSDEVTRNMLLRAAYFAGLMDSRGGSSRAMFILGGHELADAGALAPWWVGGEDLNPEETVELLDLLREEERVRRRVESPVELAFWDAYWSNCHRLPSLRGLRPQVLAEGFRIDFAIPDRLLGIELDGYTYHSSPAAFDRDRSRQRKLEMAGWRLLRFTGNEVRAGAMWCVETAARWAAAEVRP